MDKVVAALNGVAALVMAGATAILGFTIPGIWSLQSDMGGVKGKTESIDKRLEAADAKIDALVKLAEGINLRLIQRDTDPGLLIAQAGLRPSTEFAGARVGAKLYVLPKTDEAQAELVGLGLRREAITPSTFGYVLGGWTAEGVLRLNAGSASFDSNAGTAPPPAPR